MFIKNIFLKVVKHLHENAGAYNLLLAIVVAIIALYSLQLTINPPIKKPDIQLYTDALNDELILNTSFGYGSSFNLYIYNGGTAPCFDVKLTTHTFIDRANMVLPEKKIIPAINNYPEPTIDFYLGIIKPDDTFKIGLSTKDLTLSQLKKLLKNTNPTKLFVECSEDSETKTLFLKMNENN